MASPATDEDGALPLDDRFLVEIALKNRLLTREAVDRAMRLRAERASHGGPSTLEAILLEKRLLTRAVVDRIRRAQAATQALRLDSLYAEAARRLGVVDEAALAELLAERRRAPRLDRIGDALLDRGAVDPAAHARVLREMRRAIDAGEEAYVAALRARADGEPGRSPLPRPAPARVEEPSPSSEDALSDASVDARESGAGVSDASDEDLFDSAVRSLAEIEPAAKRKALHDKDLAEVDDSIAEAQKPAARPRRPSTRPPLRPAPTGAPVASKRLAALFGVALACMGGLVYSLTGPDDGGHQAPPVEVARPPRKPVSLAPSGAAPGARAAASTPPPSASAPAPAPSPDPSRPTLPSGPDPAAFQRLFNAGQLAEKEGKAEAAAAIYRRALEATEPGSARAVLVRLRLDACERALSQERPTKSTPSDLWKRALDAIREGRMADALAPLDTLAGTHRDDRAIRAAAFAREVQDMVYVPPGAFVLGMDEPGAAHCGPRRTFEGAAFFIDRRETTNADFRAYVEATGAQRPSAWVAPGANPIPGDEDRPVVMVTQDESARYAAWRGKRLPTEEEWERAARGADGRRYPWGADDPLGRAHVAAGDVEGGGTRAAGGTLGDLSPAGCLDMAGNVAEWTASVFRCYPGGSPSAADFSEQYRVVRGGSWRFDASYARCAWRDRARPGERLEVVGFRCARDVPPWLDELR